MVSEKICFNVYIDGNPFCSDVSWKVKGQPWPDRWDLFIGIVLLG